MPDLQPIIETFAKELDHATMRLDTERPNLKAYIKGAWNARAGLLLLVGVVCSWKALCNHGSCGCRDVRLFEQGERFARLVALAGVQTRSKCGSHRTNRHSEQVSTLCRCMVPPTHKWWWVYADASLFTETDLTGNFRLLASNVIGVYVKNPPLGKLPWEYEWHDTNADAWITKERRKQPDTKKHMCHFVTEIKKVTQNDSLAYVHSWGQTRKQSLDSHSIVCLTNHQVNILGGSIQQHRCNRCSLCDDHQTDP